MLDEKIIAGENWRIIRDLTYSDGVTPLDPDDADVITAALFCNDKQVAVYNYSDATFLRKSGASQIELEVSSAVSSSFASASQIFLLLTITMPDAAMLQDTQTVDKIYEMVATVE